MAGPHHPNKQSNDATTHHSNDRLTGTLSEAIQDLPLLTNVYLEGNRLEGTLPQGLFHLKRLSYGAQ